MIKHRPLLLIFTIALLVSLTRITLADHEPTDGQTIPQYKPTAEQMIIDGLIYRPLELAGTAVGIGVFIVTLPFSILGGNVDQAGQTLVVNPARATFGRCLGCIHSYSNSRKRK